MNFFSPPSSPPLFFSRLRIQSVIMQQVVSITPFRNLLSTSVQKVTLNIDLVIHRTFIVLFLQSPIVHSTVNQGLDDSLCLTYITKHLS